jgi:cobalt-zinc-cadmium efflux system membrane fusion protein
MDLSVVTARAQVPEAQVSQVHAGQACRFFPADASMVPTAGRVTVMSRAVDPQRRTVEVWCEIPNAGGKLRAAVFGDVRIATGTSNGVVVPQPAVQFNEGTRSGAVMVVDDKKIAHKRDVETGETQNGKVQILKGLKAGETVIIEGGYGLPDGTEVSLGAAAK